MKYQIEATLVKDGGEPVYWYRFSDKALTEKDCLKILGDDKHTKLENFSCKKVKSESVEGRLPEEEKCNQQ